MFDALAFDADDTLWHNETLFRECHAEFQQLLSHYHDQQWIEDRLYEAAIRNISHFGYGVKSFTLSMVETAIELTEGRIAGADVQRILDLGRSMLGAPIALLDDVAETLDSLASHHDLMLITKGDLIDQESKLERSGLRHLFAHVEVVSRKEPGTYDRILKRHTVHPDRFVMVGDSLRSDILPVLHLGGWAVHIPCPTPSKHELVEGADPTDPRYRKIDRMGQLPETLAELAAGTVLQP
jgi:putative hydrolase of the HAD superfamily